MARKRDPYEEQAAAQSIVRFGPEMSALRALLASAQQSYADRVRAAKSARQFTVGAVDAAVPAVKSAYRGASAAVSPAFAAQGGVEAGAMGARLGEAQALANSQLAARRVSAVEGEGAAVAQALRDVRADRIKIGDRGLDLAREMGAFQSATAGDLRSADAKATADAAEAQAGRNQSERNSIRSAGFDPDTGLPLPGGKADPKKKDGKKWASLEAQSAAQDDIDTLRGFAETLKTKGGVNRADAAQALLVGQEAKEVPIYETVDLGNGRSKQQKVLWKKGDKIDGKPIEKVAPEKIGTQRTQSIPKVPQAKSRLLLTAALDVAYDGHLSRRTQKLLHDRGIKLAPLGLMTFGQWLKTPEGQEWRRQQRGQRRTGSGVSSTPAASDGYGGFRRT